MSHNHDEHCHDEHHDHDAHDHSDDLTPAIQNLLQDKIDFDGLRTLNEKVAGSGKAIVKKSWAQREDLEPELESDADEQLLMHIP